jgi:hypothetical protein
MPVYYNAKTCRARIVFRFPRGRAGRQFSHTDTFRSERDAQRFDAAIEETIQDLARGKLTLPPDAGPDDVKAFLISGGKVTSRVAPVLRETEGSASVLTLGHLFARYEADLTPGAKESNTLETVPLDPPRPSEQNRTPRPSTKLRRRGPRTRVFHPDLISCAGARRAKRILGSRD